MPKFYGESHDIEERISACISSFSDGEIPNIAAAARDWCVPVSRLRARVKGRMSRHERTGSNLRLSPVQDEALKSYIRRCDSIGMPCLMPQLKGAAQYILDRAHPDGSAPLLSKDWTTRWLQRNPECRRIKQKSQEINRTAMATIEAYSQHFTELKKVIDAHGITPSDTYNMDETGFRIGVGGSQWIVTMELNRPQVSASETSRDHVTSIESISGDGEVLDPMLILQGVNHIHQWYTNTALPDDYMIATSTSGYTNDSISIEWLKFFEKQTRARQKGAWRLLIFDGFGSHLTIEFIEYCDRYNIIPFSLPPHASHHLQPLDVVCFQPLKNNHKKAVEMATRTGCTDFNKVEFLHAYHGIRMATFKRSTILSAWEKSGIFPFNPEIVYMKLPTLRTPSPSLLSAVNSSPIANTPTSYQQQHKKMSRALERSNISSRRLEKFLESSQLLIDSLALAQRDLLAITAAAQQRQKRQVKDARQVQKGGVVTVKAARQAIDHRVEQEAQKAARKAAKTYKDAHLQAQQSQPRQVPSLREMTVDPALLATPTPVYISPYN